MFQRDMRLFGWFSFVVFMVVLWNVDSFAPVVQPVVDWLARP